jgi:proliferating cell nuclear antigen
MFRATISDKKLLIDSIATIAELIDEGVFKISKEGISLMAADRAMVAVVNFKISSKAFDEFEVDKEQEIGLNISNFLSVLKRAKGDDKITLRLQDSSKLEIVFKNSSKRRFVLPLLDITQEEVPPIDQLEFKASAELEPEVLESGIQDADVVSDALLFEATSNKLIMRAEGDISKTEMELEKGEKPLIDLKSDGSVRSRYPLDYLKKMIKASKLSDRVKIYFGQDYPMKIDFVSGDKVRLIFVVAPRVVEE